jgi:hypothetical protein
MTKDRTLDELWEAAKREGESEGLTDREIWLVWWNSLSLDQLDEVAGHLEAKGLFEKVRDANGDVVMKPDSKGTPRIVWRVLDRPPSTARH